MNTKSFETLENTVLSEYLKEKGLSEVTKQKWYRIIIENKTLFKGKNYDEICELVESLAFDGIDGDIVNATATTIASDNEIELSFDKSGMCMFLYGRLKATK
ncbi:MAG: hypothetical protein IJX65_06880 [Alistipes sp.]|nr:hypothetical protein [Alistipes sp.]